MKLSLKIIFILLACYLLISLMGCASGSSNVYYGASVHYSTGWGGGYYGGHRPPHYRPPPAHRPPSAGRPPGGRPPGGRPPGGGGGPRPTPMPSRR